MFNISVLKVSSILIFLSIAIPSIAQHETENTQVDSSNIKSIKDFMNKSVWHFHSRSFFMTTINDGALKDDYALAQGAGIGLLTTPIKGFQLGLSGYFIFNVFSSDLASPDSITGLKNRYELGQFDVLRPTNKYDFDRLEDLFIKYKIKKTYIKLGRMELQTPFLNMQDGRMRPTIEEGIWLNSKELKNIEIQAGYIWGISPRSTVDWFKTSESIGIYGQGVNVDGTKSNYANNLESKGIVLFNLNYKYKNKAEIILWNAYIENISNTSMLEIKNEHLLGNVTIYNGLMYFHQRAIHDGGNVDQAKTYINKNAKTNVISLQVGAKKKRWNVNLNYTHITDDGRYLMPREWGRDPFYTFMSRERNEGAGNVHAFTTNIVYTSLNNKLKSGVSYGYINMPSVFNFRLNKYGMPTYHQLNLSSSYNFQNFWKGMEFRVLMASKFNGSEELLQAKHVYNKINMLNFNFIVDIRI